MFIQNEKIGQKMFKICPFGDVINLWERSDLVPRTLNNPYLYRFIKN